GLIQFDFELGCWQCDISQVTMQAVTDDVVGFMSLQLRKLPPSTQEVLQLAACIGNSFDLATLAIVSEQSQIETAACLWKALQEGLVLPIGDVYKFYVGQETLVRTSDNQEIVTYKFLHDRVQQAAYSLIPDNQKQLMHLKIGRLLLSVINQTEKEEKTFEIVNQLNKGSDLIESQNEREELANLNLVAAQKARSATAYIAAIEYATQGIQLLSPNGWQKYYDLILALHDLAAEVACLSGEFTQMQEMVDEVLQNAHQLLDKVKVYEVMILAYVAQNRQLKAIQTALAVLELFGVSFPEHPTQIDVSQSLQQTQNLFQGKDLAQLLKLPEMTDLEALAEMRILATINAAVYQTIPELLPLIVCTQVRLSIQYGNADVSAQAYAWYGVILCIIGEIDLGNRVGDLAMELLPKFESREFQTSTINMVYSFVKPWKNHIQSSLVPLLDGYHRGLEMGTLEYAIYCVYNYCTLSFFLGQDLSVLEPEMKVYSHVFAQLKQDTTHNYLKIYYQSVLNLLGKSQCPWQIQGVVYDEEIMLPKHQEGKDFYALGTLYISKLALCYLFNEWEQAKKVAIEAKENSHSLSGFFIIPVFHFYDSLTHLATLPNTEDREDNLPQQVIDNQTKLKQWAEYAPNNYLHKFYLVEAEQYRVLGNKSEAIEYYERAITEAKANGYIQEEGLANELAARFYLAWGKEKVAAVYMQEAYYCYARWGAKAKVGDLEQRYSQLLAPILQQNRSQLSTNDTIFTLGTVTSTSSATKSSSSISDTLDLKAILKASQTISSEIELEKLLTSLLSIVIETAGADKSVLMLFRDNRLLIKGSITQGTNPVVLQRIPVGESQDIPHKLIYKVKNSQQTVVLLDATADITFANDPYIIRQQPKSILCMPILHQGKFLGILYLENNLAKGAFTSARVELLNLLCAQAAISLENAQLYQLSLEYAQQLEQALHNLQQAQLQIVQSEKMSALGNMVAGVAHEMNNPLGFIAASLQQAKPTVFEIVEHLKLYQETLTDPTEEIQTHAEEIDLEYSLEDLPKMLDSMSVACDRLKNISTSLRTFSRADREYKVPFNLHEGIESTLLILKHRLKANDQRPAIEVVIDYGNLPQIECFPGQLNQVFMNILANAIDAVEESNLGRSLAEIKAKTNQITIQTSLVDKLVEIRINDNGKGMTEAVKAKIFDHLFTTKAVGKGTGLGLAIARQIVVEKHQGSIEVESTVGRGTQFCIRLPIST
ncbi:trifunctional serine/threonine-protein kinase/ATP-binding protein/sensor histidine kinase, partial [Aerosakkonema funiforme]|uniref:trifunctional serine/threonine-protein kinase/ATP-binding protein/sensor histidine kinase n=1 Tax=Aerosakkonema funiforme TaxID=1246630 RepID=UPI0035B804F0